jgi:DinB superfamily
MNPYASHLGTQDPIRVLSTTPSRCEEIAASLGEPGINQRFIPGKWSAREILIHLADCEVTFAFRYRQALAEDHHVIQPFDQEKWAQSYAAYSGQEALRTLVVVRDWNLALIRTVTPEQMSRTLNHPERGNLTFRTLIETAAGHDINHLRQLENLQAAAERRPA